MRDGAEGQPLQAQLALRSLTACSLVSAQKGAADRVGKKGFAEKGCVLLQLFRVSPKGLGEGAPPEVLCTAQALTSLSSSRSVSPLLHKENRAL